MNYKELGNTGVRLSEIGCGTWRYNGGIAPIKKAIELGTVLIDTAESYGSEEVVGEAAREFRNRVFIATKVSPRNFRRLDLLRAAERSLAKLKTDHIDLYQLHWPNYTLPIAETMSAMEELVDAGKVRFIGVSNFSVPELRKAQAALSKYRIVSNQVRYSLIERTPELGMLDFCRKNKITVIAFSPLGESFSRIKAADPEGVLSNIAGESGKTEAQTTLNWLTGKENVVAIPKAANVLHAAENCGGSGWYLSSSQCELLDTQIRFRRRGPFETAARRYVKHAGQIFGRYL